MLFINMADFLLQSYYNILKRSDDCKQNQKHRYSFYHTSSVTLEVVYVLFELSVFHYNLKKSNTLCLIWAGGIFPMLSIGQSRLCIMMNYE